MYSILRIEREREREREREKGGGGGGENQNMEEKKSADVSTDMILWSPNSPMSRQLGIIISFLLVHP
jgi:hypothetical protein